MRDRRRCLLGACGLALSLMLAGIPAALAGGFYISVEAPSKGSPQAKGAVLILRADGCIKPSDAVVTATAEGIVGGKRQSLPLRLTSVSPGVFALKRQWPAEGAWVLAVNGTANGMLCSKLVELGSGGQVQTVKASKRGTENGLPVRTAHRRFTPQEIDGALQDLTARTQKLRQVSKAKS